VIDSGHLLNGGLRGTIRVKYPGYHGSSIMAQNSRYDRFPPVANSWGTIHPVPHRAPPLQAEEEGATNLKRTNPVSNPRLRFFHPTMGTCKHDFATCLTVPSPSSTWGETRASDQTCPGALSNGYALSTLGLQEAVAWAPGMMLIACTRVPNPSHHCLTY
jgi:hypothetical protein